MTDDASLSPQARYKRRKTEESKDIGELPPVVNPERRAMCEADPVEFLRVYFPRSTGLSPLSDDHKRMIARMSDCATKGGRFANAVYRGFGKTSVALGMALWAVLYGRRKFVLLLGSRTQHAAKMMQRLQTELYNNDLLLEDFPEVCYPIRCLGGTHHKAAHQLYHGEQTKIEWKARVIALPTIKGNVSSGAILMCDGTSAATRGVFHTRPDGTVERPDMVIGDDIQTDKSARSAMQIENLIDFLQTSVANLGDHRKEMAIVINGTVIEPGDVMDQLLDARKFPSWQSERIPMVKAWSKNDAMWKGQYSEIRNGFNPELPGDQLRAWRDATAFYLEHLAEMDDGMVVSWAECYKRDHELSANQHAYNLLLDNGERAFASECQNQPIDPTQEDSCQPKPREIAARVNGLDRRQIDDNATDVAGFIDVQESSLWFVLLWFHRSTFTAGVLDYGAWPEQSSGYYTLASLNSSGRTIQSRFPTGGLESQWVSALTALTDDLLGREYKSPGGNVLRVGKLGIDANYGKSTNTVKAFCRASRWSSVLVPYHGKFVGASSTPFDQYQKRPGEIVGPGWRLVKPTAGGVRHCNADTNAWKSSALARIKTPIGDPGALTLYGRDGQDHRMIADHLVSEYPVRVNAKGRDVDEWKERPERPDNHLWDCLVGAMVMASMCGVTLGGSFESRGSERKKAMSLAELAQMARSGKR